MNKRHYEHTLPNIRGSLSNTYVRSDNHSFNLLKYTNMEGKKFKHKFLSSLTCEVVAETRKGYKVLETQVFNGRKKPKTKTAYYFNVDFDKQRGVWEEITK